MAALFAPATAPSGFSPLPCPASPCSGLLSQGLLDSAGQCVQTRVKVARYVRTQGPPATFRKNLQIAARLRRLDHAKRVGMTGHWQVFGVVAGDLQENAAVRSTLVG